MATLNSAGSDATTYPLKMDDLRKWIQNDSIAALLHALTENKFHEVIEVFWETTELEVQFAPRNHRSSRKPVHVKRLSSPHLVWKQVSTRPSSPGKDLGQDRLSAEEGIHWGWEGTT